MTIYQAIANALTQYVGQPIGEDDIQVIGPSTGGRTAPFAVHVAWMDELEGFLVPVHWSGHLNWFAREDEVEEVEFTSWPPTVNGQVAEVLRG